MANMRPSVRKHVEETVVHAGVTDRGVQFQPKVGCQYAAGLCIEAC